MHAPRFAASTRLYYSKIYLLGTGYCVVNFVKVNEGEFLTIVIVIHSPILFTVYDILSQFTTDLT